MNATLSASPFPSNHHYRHSGSSRTPSWMPLSARVRMLAGLPAITDSEAALYRLAREAVADQQVRDLLAEEPEGQVVVLDASDDMTGCRIGADRRIAGCAPGRFFELDLPDAIAAKSRKLDRMRQRQAIHDRHVARVGFDPGRVSMAKTLLDAGFDRDLPTLWICAGNAPVDPGERHGYRLDDFFQVSAPGSRLVFDVAGSGAGIHAFDRWLGMHGWALDQTLDTVDMALLWTDITGAEAPVVRSGNRRCCVARRR